MKQHNQTSFIRVVKSKNYTVMDNEFLRRDDLSWRAKGILAYILTLPDDWNINLNEVMRHATDGKHSFRSGWGELQEAGYVYRYPVKDEKTKRILRWETIVKESVNLAVETSEPHSDLPHLEKPYLEKPYLENQTLLSTDNTKYLNIQSTDSESEAAAPKSTEEPRNFKEIVNYLNDKTGKNFSYKTSKTRKLIEARYNEGFSTKDFKKVIDIKCDEWLESKKMSQYLRPQTLFSNKFDEYLNQGVAIPNKENPLTDNWERELDSL